MTKVKTENVGNIFTVKEESDISDVGKGGKKTILVVDDNKDIVWLIANVLSDYRIKSASCVDDAMTIIKAETPALIITDIMMPGIDGLEFITFLKADKFTKHIPVVVISAKNSDKDQSKGLDLGADA